MASQQEYIKALERRNQELESELAALRNLQDEFKLVSKENQFYDKIARDIEKWLSESQMDLTGITWDPKEGKWIMQGDVLFDSGRYTISSNGRDVLKTLADAYAGKSVRFRIAGHTDRDVIKKTSTKKALPVSSTNMELSALRAVAVFNELLKNGIAENRVFVEGHGNNSPVAPNDNSPSNKRLNRRVEIFILDGEPAK
jgi:flagellar motor protein MotB